MTFSLKIFDNFFDDFFDDAFNLETFNNLVTVQSCFNLSISYCLYWSLFHDKIIIKYFRLFSFYAYFQASGSTLTQQLSQYVAGLLGPKIQQTKMLVTCQRFGVLVVFGLVWQYSSIQTSYNKGRLKVMATYLQQ
jgi:hypothetical protein